jgi:hypothetical protein
MFIEVRVPSHPLAAKLDALQSELDEGQPWPAPDPLNSCTAPLPAATFIGQARWSDLSGSH